MRFSLHRLILKIGSLSLGDLLKLEAIIKNVAKTGAHIRTPALNVEATVAREFFRSPTESQAKQYRADSRHYEFFMYI